MKLRIAVALLTMVATFVAAQDVGKGIEAYYQADYETAIAAFEGVDLDAVIQGEAVMALKYLGACRHATGDEAGATRAFKELVARDPSFELTTAEFSPPVVEVFANARSALVEERYRAARRAYDAGDFEEAVRLFQKVLELDSAHAMSRELGTLAKQKLAAMVPTPTPSPTPPAEPFLVKRPRGYGVEPIRRGAQVYVDREYIWDDYPAELNGALCVQPSADDVNRSDTSIDVEILVPGTLYLLIDAEVNVSGAWLEKFHLLEQRATIGNPKIPILRSTLEFEIFKVGIEPRSMTLKGLSFGNARDHGRVLMSTVCFRPAR